MVNRAWRGIRLVTEKITEDAKEYIYTIGWHVPIGMFYLEQQITHLDRKPIPETFGSMPYFACTVKPLIQHIEKQHNVKIEVVSETNIEQAEEYDIEDGKRLLEKYPKWKTEIDSKLILS